jgi:DNA helicase-2/ATP-dependent DNA helicase PcrA
MDRILSQLNPYQQEAVKTTEGPLLILAGAGSGKTRTLTHKTAWLVEKKKVDPSQILLVTFTNRAANEMKERLKKLLGAGRLPQAGTFHSFCARILRREGKHLGIPANFVIFDTPDQQATVKQAMIEADISTRKFRPGSILATISQAKNELIGPTEYPQYARGPFQKVVAQVFLIYQKFLREYHALDFDDLLGETVRLFRREEAVLGKYQNQFRYLLVDEYQDTNRAQYQLTKMLAKRWRNLCVVGDCSQSIYSWRGADFRNVLNLKSDFPALRTINLEENYRSTQTILEAANKVISENTTHPVLKLWTKNPKGERVTLYEAGSELEEALYVANMITRHLRENEALSFSDFAILYRTNAQSRVLEEVLLRAGLPYILIGGTRFYERKEIKDCLAYLRLLENPADLVSYERIQKIGKRRMDRFFDLKEKISVPKMTTLELLDEVLEATTYLELYDEKKEEDMTRLENIKELRSVATQFPKLLDFLENVALIQQETLPQDKSEPKGQQKAITLMTIHAAKGSEFSVVFMVGMEEGLFPHSRSLLEKDELEEERRLCYVGMTRAREKLYLAWARRRLYFGQRTTNPTSRFISNIPAKLLETILEENQDFDTMDDNADS